MHPSISITALENYRLFNVIDLLNPTCTSRYGKHYLKSCRNPWRKVSIPAWGSGWAGMRPGV